MSNFAFLQPEWPNFHEAAAKAESLAYPDPRASCFYARRALEVAVNWLYKHDSALKLPYQDQLSALIFEPTFRQTVGDAVFSKARVVKDLGNLAVHSHRPIQQADAFRAVKELFHVCWWLAHTYSLKAKPPPGLTFDPALLPRHAPAPPQTLEQLSDLEAQLHERDEKLSTLLADNLALDEQLRRIRVEIAAVKKANAASADTHDYSEAETRDAYIDLLLKEAGWSLETANREVEVSGMPNNRGLGKIDYVLWGDDGKPLGLVEAKRTKRDPQEGQQQAKLYADCLDRQFGQRPIIFYSNGYEHWLWDDRRYPPRSVQGFYTRTELELLIQRRASRKPLAAATVDKNIVDRYYQLRAIRRIGEALDVHNQRRALVVMATGAGKTRTVIALCELLMRCNWVKRVLFLADRVALVNQTVNAFKRHLPDASPVNLVTDRYADGRVYVSTYPTTMGLIDDAEDGRKRFGAGHFDLVIIDEAHRSVYQKYRAIFEYFDSLLVGLTATPKDEIDRNTYGLFDLERGVPTDAYGLDEAVKDGFLVPLTAVSVPLKFQRQGITYDELSEDEQEQWDALEWNDEGETPDRVDPAAVNKWLFNQDTVDKVLEHVMTRGQKVAGGDRLAKTIVFAKNAEHARFIVQRFNVNYPHYKGEFARVVTHRTEYVQSIIEDFAVKDRAPHMAASVDMLDTGIDIPEVANLVFFKLVRSRTKFWQMIGRGTRLCPDLFGTGDDKRFFYLFDYCGNLEFFKLKPDMSDGALIPPLSQRLFRARLTLIGALDEKLEPGEELRRVAETRAAYVYDESDTATEEAVRQQTAELLRLQVVNMNVDNFVVRPKRRLVEKYAQPAAWIAPREDDFDLLSRELSGLPTAKLDPDEEAKRFDLLMLRLQLALLRAEPGFVRLREQARVLVGLLEEKAAIPMVHEQLALIEDVAGEEWWHDVTVPMLETARKRLRDLIKFIDKSKRRLVYTDFEDELGQETGIDFPVLGSGTDFERFRAKARQFLVQHQDHVVIHKLRRNQPLTATDLDELERMLVDAGAGTADDLSRAKQNGLGLFIRSLVGLDREAAKDAFGQFLAGGTATPNQIEFVDLAIDYLTEHGLMEPALLYESPFTDVSPQGPEAIFSSAEVDQMIEILADIRDKAAA